MDHQHRDVRRAERGIARSRRLADLPLTYTWVGASMSDAVPGPARVTRARRIGQGEPAFRAASELLLTWGMHRDAGLAVRASDERVRLGSVVVLDLGRRPFRLRAPCRVVAVIDEPRRQGFAYGTLPGHPESGEELFLVTLTDDGLQVLVQASSRPATWWARAGAPVTRAVQALLLDRYVRALARAARAADRLPPT
ncbi:DUF1990 family protein [Cellulomonas aerilata]|uniref:DUF1990 domain-containing protein n=1 Tax=Cellulomonas aerilata TaxID=515326 RepID=A0A512D9X5_9CELL|nr:DUF1990 domain-containing protein [Cellulomonas aerilata]GEO33266.1 DUF1990 domain-containing protein [Cellulomonas aerilata]